MCGPRHLPLLESARGLSAALAVLMALVTVNAVVDVTLHAGMVAVGLRRRVTVRALKDRIVIRIDMARRANVVGVTVVRWKRRVLRMIERCARPGRGVMAVLARRWEELRLCRMARVRRVAVIGLMATDARRRQGGVVVVHVAVAALPRRHRV